MTNTFTTGTNNFFVLENVVARFKQNPLNQGMNFYDAVLVDALGNPVCRANVSGLIEAVVEMLPDAVTGEYVDGVRYVFSISGGNIVKVLVS